LHIDYNSFHTDNIYKATVILVISGSVGNGKPSEPFLVWRRVFNHTKLLRFHSKSNVQN